MVVFYTNNISPHQLPLAHGVARRVGHENFVYVGDEIAWRGKVVDAGEIKTMTRAECGELLETCEVMYTSLRDLALLERRAAKGLKTFYYGERWFKPIPIGGGLRCLRGLRSSRWLDDLYLPGSLRMLVPGYRKMARRFVKWANSDPNAKVLAIGPWAKKDFLKMGVKEVKIVDWGYFVAPSTLPSKPFPSVALTKDGSRTLRVLWVGREGVAWKRVKDIERAVALANKKLTSAVNLNLQPQPISFTKLTGVSLSEVRAAMRNHDVYILSSNAEEGWGAALNEAFEEGMCALGTFEAGASAAMLPRERLYHAGDVRALARLLELEVEGLRLKVEGKRPILSDCSIGEWTAEKAAQRLVDLI